MRKARADPFIDRDAPVFGLIWPIAGHHDVQFGPGRRRRRISFHTGAVATDSPGGSGSPAPKAALLDALGSTPRRPLFSCQPPGADAPSRAFLRILDACLRLGAGGEWPPDHAQVSDDAACERAGRPSAYGARGSRRGVWRVWRSPEMSIAFCVVVKMKSSAREVGASMPTRARSSLERNHGGCW